MSNGQRPDYAEKRSTTCPNCTSDKIIDLPPVNPGSELQWFRCGNCDHLWSHRRDRRVHGDRLNTPPQPPDPPAGEGAGN
jgi:hypothetical protein